MLSYTSRNQQLDTISQCLFTSPSQLLMIAVRGEHNLEHHPTVLESLTISRILKPIKIPNHMARNSAYASATSEDATSEWRTIFDAKISPPTSRTTSPEINQFLYVQINQSQQQKRRHYSLVPRLKTQDTVEIYGYYLPHSEDTEDNELL
ncbi:hypothetical protein PVK06_036203 [Gossypium arboreum]|uniref:Uncharacterized protein n=1 Tax=Gossypium arboreum TaxID=29729 RepID=A0ABR0NIW8_GOSAR|nr:hypothetical protein PVK06_036203 [Gossypium arboreum]